jgi:hypothetical protein
MTTQEWFARDLVGDTSAHECGFRLWALANAKSAAASPVGVVLAFFCVIAAMVSGSIVPFLAIPVPFLLRFTTSFMNGKTRQDALRRARHQPIRLPDLLAFTEPRVRSVIARLGSARSAIRDLAEAAPHGAAFDLSSALEVVPEVERNVVVLAARIEYLSSFLGPEAIPTARNEVARLRQCADREGGTAGEIYRQAAQTCQSRLDALTELAAQNERLVADAEQALGLLEGLPGKIAALQYRRLESCDDPSQELRREQDRLSNALRALEEGASAEG